MPSRLMACGRTAGEPVGDGRADGGCDIVAVALEDGGWVGWRRRCDVGGQKSARRFEVAELVSGQQFGVLFQFGSVASNRLVIDLFMPHTTTPRAASQDALHSLRLIARHLRTQDA